MKKIALNVLLILTIISCKCNKIGLNNSETKEKVIVKSNVNIYEIIKIDSIQNVYLIYGEKNDSIFKIASSKNEGRNCIQIKKGDLLELELKSSFRENFYQRRDIAGVRYNGVLVKFEKKDEIVWDLFTTDNIKGLCYIE